MKKLALGLAFGLVAAFGASTNGTVHGGEGADRIDYYIALNTLFDGPTQGQNFCYNMGCELAPGAGFLAGLNDHPQSNVGGLDVVVVPDSCVGDDCLQGEHMIGYCTEADVPAEVFELSDYNEISLDPRLQYLTFSYDRHFYDLRRDAGGDAISEFAAVQALVWAWQSDPNTGSTVFSSADDPYDDPFEWDGLIPVAPETQPTATPGLGFWSTYTGTQISDLDDATQAVYDLAVEAQNKAGDWSLSHSDDGEGIYLLNENGLPIYGETVVFDDHGAEAVTDSSGYVAWPDGSMYAVTLKPGRPFETPGAPDDNGNSSQNVVVTLGEPISILNNFTATPTTTTTTTPDPTVELPATGGNPSNWPWISLVTAGCALLIFARLPQRKPAN